MIRYLAAVALIALFVTPALAQQDFAPHQMTDLPLLGRYQIVQSQLARRYTFRLDRATGIVDRLVSDSEGYPTWAPMPIFPDPELEAGSFRFTIFASGWTVKDIFLMDTFTGITWQLGSVDGTVGWFLMADPRIESLIDEQGLSAVINE